MLHWATGFFNANYSLVHVPVLLDASPPPGTPPGRRVIHAGCVTPYRVLYVHRHCASLRNAVNPQLFGCRPMAREGDRKMSATPSDTVVATPAFAPFGTHKEGRQMCFVP